MGQLILGLVGICLAAALLMGASTFVVAVIATGAEAFSSLLNLNPIVGWFILGSLLGLGTGFLLVFKLIPRELPRIQRSAIQSLVRIHGVIAGVLMVAMVVAAIYLVQTYPVHYDAGGNPATSDAECRR